MVIHRLNVFLDSPGRRLKKIALGFIMAFTFGFIIASVVHFIWPTYGWHKALGSAFGAGLGTGLFYAVCQRSS